MPKHTDAAAKIADMDKAGIEMTALSINDPGPELFGKDSTAMAVLLNDFIADTVRQHPKRFFGLATLPFQSPDAMLKEFDRAIGKLGMKGILLYSNLDGKFPDEPAYRPLYAEAERRNIPILLHPGLPMTYSAVSDYQMVPMLGLMFDTTIALCRLILSGVLDKHPNLKLVCPHVGRRAAVSHRARRSSDDGAQARRRKHSHGPERVSQAHLSGYRLADPDGDPLRN